MLGFKTALNPLRIWDFPTGQAGNIVIGEIAIANLPTRTNFPNILAIEKPAPPQWMLNESISDIDATRSEFKVETNS
ncbi:hypothetical protein XM38_028450 [Halomicronema hongdechloris C2206]|uniref:Uncharacterized protein n=1 Tax=Halomicronema hongdechloris C2206 TaxID=1641165 RepID=A0A1Z3HNM4_9CYAN|nr:hypothetical protein [Halomicronema hongdechloris]ASC71891.1 hypothetical protein XM38_028450 [Halomicronema hongdechloris C2206]